MVRFFYPLQHRFGGDDLWCQSSWSSFEVNDHGMMGVNQIIIEVSELSPFLPSHSTQRGDRRPKDIAFRADELGYGAHPDLIKTFASVQAVMRPDRVALLPEVVQPQKYRGTYEDGTVSGFHQASGSSPA